jgi:ubiquinone/menaquinone biosynthesis C-methylase UbiE
VSWLFAWAYDSIMKNAERASLATWRRDLIGDLAGAVLEIGAGTGANVPFYPSSVTRLVLAEPDRHMRARLAETARGREALVSAAAAEALPFADASFDAIVCTLVLCSVVDPARVLAEARRVLVPKGALVYLEHVAEQGRLERLVWQRRVEPAWKWLAAGCHLTRDTGAAIRDAGFTIEREERESARKTMVLARRMIRGVARAP